MVANEVVTRAGTDVENTWSHHKGSLYNWTSFFGRMVYKQNTKKKTSVIIGLATAISPIPPVQRRADVEKRSQNFSKVIISLFWQIDQLVACVLQHPRGRNEP